MSVTVRDIDAIATLGLHWAHAKHAEGFHDGRIFAGQEPEIGAQQDTPAVIERRAFRAYADKINALREKARQGEESKEAEAVPERRTIRTLEELDALPKYSVVLEDQYEAAYQKDGDGPDAPWSGDGRYYDAVQIDLPVTVIYEGVRK